MSDNLDENQIEQISALAQGALHQIDLVRELWFDSIYVDLHDEQRASEDEEYLELIASVIDEIDLAELGLDIPASATEWMARRASLAELTREHVADRARANRDVLVGVARQIDKAHAIATSGADELGIDNEPLIGATAIKFPNNKLRTACARYDEIIDATRVEPMK